MANEIYHRSNWGNAVNDIAWGDTYEKFDATNEMFVRSDNYENSNETDKLMSAINPKPSILLTPTAYDNGSLHSVKPVQTFGSELVTNGDFATDSDWSLSENATISNGQLNLPNNLAAFQTGIPLNTEVKFIVQGSGTVGYRLGTGIGYTQITLPKTIYTTTHSVGGRVQFYNTSGSDVTINSVSIKEVTDADFDFTRGSSATRVNEQGLIEDVQILSGELVQNGNFEQIGSELVTNGGFDTDSDWTLESGWSISNGKLLGTLSNSTNAYQAEVLEAGKIYQITYEISNYSQGAVRFQLAGGGGTVSGTINSSNGVFTEKLKATVNHTSIRFRSFATDGGFTASIDNVSVKEVGQNWTFGTGWSIEDGKAISVNASNQSLSQSTSSVLLNKKYRISFDVEYISGSAKFQLVGGTTQDVVTITSSGTQVIEVVSDADKTSYRIKGLTTGSGFNGSIDNISIIEITDDTNLPRIDYTDGTGSLLLEPQSTNLITYSEDFSQSSWQKQSAGVASAPIVTSNYSISPDGTLNADRVVFNINAGTTSSDFSQIADQITNNIGDVTNSIWIKSNTTSNYNMSFVDPNANYTSIVVTTEWRRFDVTSTTSSTASALRLRLRGSEATSNSADVSVWGAQVEEQSFATSYIPTSGSPVTRDADVCNNSGSSDLINSTEGVLYAEIAALADDLTFRGIALSDGTNDNRVLLRYRTTSNQINLFIRANSTTIVNSTKALTDITNYSKIAIKYKSGDIALWVDGQEAKTHTNTFTLIGLDRLNFDAGNGSDDFYGKVKCIAVFKEALTDEELTALTT